MIFINQSVGFLQNDIIESFIDDNNKILFCGKNIKTLPKNCKIVYSISYNKKNIFTRFSTWFGFTLHLFLYLLFHKVKNQSLFIVSNPPLSPLLSIFSNRRCYLLIYDLYPDVLVNTGMLSKNNFIVKSWSKLNTIAFKKARIIFTISNSMQKELSKYVDKNKIKVIYNWSQEFIKKDLISLDERFKIIYGKYIILYSGNLGLTHDLETLIYAAKQIEDLKVYPNIHFVFNGDGLQKEKLISITQDNKSTNISFFNHLSDETFNALLKYSKIGVVSVSGHLDDNILPSKIYNYLASSLPLICIASSNSELNNFTIKHNIGLVANNKDIKSLISNILKLYNNNNFYNIVSSNAISISHLFTKKNAQLFYKEIVYDNVT
jgi:glycosyltransferase involved in cell wall biosynthesis